MVGIRGRFTLSRRSQKTLGSTQIFNDAEKTFDQHWCEWFNDYWVAYTKTPIVRQCINLTAHYTTRKGFRTAIEPMTATPDKEEMIRLHRYVENLNKRVNLDQVITTAIIYMDVFGRTAFEIVKDEADRITNLLQLDSRKIRPHIDPETVQTDYYTYSGTGKSDRLELDDVLYFPRDPDPRNMLGFSAIETVKDDIVLRRNLYEDLKQISKRLWAPAGMFELDTSFTDDDKVAEQAIVDFMNRVKPGRTFAHNQSAKYTKIDLHADINGLIRAIDKVDEDIMGSWGIPKALLAREKTISRATLEFSLQALYDGPIAGKQRYLKRSLEIQWYDVLVRRLGLEGKYYIKHVWNPISIVNPEALKALVIAVKEDIITTKEFFGIMGWEEEVVESLDLTLSDAIKNMEGVQNATSQGYRSE